MRVGIISLFGLRMNGKDEIHSSATEGDTRSCSPSMAAIPFMQATLSHMAVASMKNFLQSRKKKMQSISLKNGGVPFKMCNPTPGIYWHTIRNVHDQTKIEVFGSVAYQHTVLLFNFLGSSHKNYANH